MRHLLLCLFSFAAFSLSAQEKPLQNSEDGWYLSPHGTIRVLVLFVEVEYDVSPGKDPQPHPVEKWPKGALPSWRDELFDPHALPVQKAVVSKYYQDISMGQFTVLGDYVDELLIVKESEYPTVHNAHGIGALAVKEANKRTTLRTRHGLGITDFDFWKDGGKPGLPKEAGADTPHSYDHVMVIARNTGLGHGAGSTDPGGPGKLFGYDSDTQSRFGAMNGMPFEILRHEFNHLLIGGNNFHSGGGNAAQFESTFLNLQGGWSMMGGNSSSLLTCTGWDRDRMGWKPQGAEHRISARGTDDGEVNGDLDPVNGDTGVFVLRDFVTSGDALRIRMPHIPEGLLSQWIWVENHQGTKRNGSPTDRFLWEGVADCIASVEPGLFMTMQVGREERTGVNIFGGIADYLRPIPATGCYDLRLRGDTLRNSCLFGGNFVPYFLDRFGANPLTGNHEQELPVYDRNGDGVLHRNEHWVPSARVDRGNSIAAVPFAGRPEHAFRMGGVRALGMCTNPSSTNMHTLVSTGTKDLHKRKGPNVRVAYLNGIRVELLDMRANGDALVRVSTNDTRMVEDMRWCADSIVLPPLRGSDGHSLTLARGVRLTVDRSRTPTRMDAPDNDAPNGPWYSDPTVFTVSEKASVLLEEKAVLDLSQGSVLHLLPGSSLTLGRKAALHIDARSKLVVHAGAAVNGKQKIFRKLRKQGRLVDAQ